MFRRSFQSRIATSGMDTTMKVIQNIEIIVFLGACQVTCAEFSLTLSADTLKLYPMDWVVEYCTKVLIFDFNLAVRPLILRFTCGLFYQFLNIGPARIVVLNLALSISKMHQCNSI